MKRILVLLATLAIGLGFGYYFGYARYARSSMKLYRQMKATTGLSDEQIIQLVKQSKEVMKYVEDDQEGTALASLVAILKIDSGDCQGAAERLAQNVGRYYRSFGPPTSDMLNTRRALLERIQAEATNHPVIARAIEAKPAQ